MCLTPEELERLRRVMPLPAQGQPFTYLGRRRPRQRRLRAGGSADPRSASRCASRCSISTASGWSGGGEVIVSHDNERLKLVRSCTSALARQARPVLRRGRRCSRGRDGGAGRPPRRGRGRRAAAPRRGVDHGSSTAGRRGLPSLRSAGAVRAPRDPGALARRRPGNVGTLIRAADGFGAGVAGLGGLRRPDEPEGAARDRGVDLARPDRPVRASAERASRSPPGQASGSPRSTCAARSRSSSAPSARPPGRRRTRHRSANPDRGRRVAERRRGRSDHTVRVEAAGEPLTAVSDTSQTRIRDLG